MFKKLIEETREKIKKFESGCREPLEYNQREGTKLACGDLDDNSIKEDTIAYCTDCDFRIKLLQVKLQTLQEAQEMYNSQTKQGVIKRLEEKK